MRVSEVINLLISDIDSKRMIIFIRNSKGNKEINLGNPLQPSGNIEADMKILLTHFIGVKGKNPDYSFEVKE